MEAHRNTHIGILLLTHLFSAVGVILFLGIGISVISKAQSRINPFGNSSLQAGTYKKASRLEFVGELSAYLVGPSKSGPGFAYAYSAAEACKAGFSEGDLIVKVGTASKNRIELKDTSKEESIADVCREFRAGELSSESIVMSPTKLVIVSHHSLLAKQD